MNHDDALVIRGPSDVIGSEVSLVQNPDGLWNATLMGRQGGREWGQFYRSEKVRQYVGELALQLKVPETSIVKYEAPMEKGAGGTTWIHKRLAYRFLAHQSPKFAVWADGVLERYLSGEITTEESKAAKKAMDALLEDSRLKYEQSQKQLQAAQVDLRFSEGRRLEALESAKRMAERVHEATAERDAADTKLGTKKAANSRASRTKAKTEFANKLREAVKAYHEGVEVPLDGVDFGSDKDGSPMTVPKFVQGLEHEFRDSVGLMKDWDMFCETPGVGWNIVPMVRPDNDAVSLENFCKHTNFFPAPNHEDKKRTLIDAGEDYSTEAPVSKKDRRR